MALTTLPLVINLMLVYIPPSCVFPNFPSFFTLSEETSDIFAKPFSMVEMESALRKCRSKLNSAPGLDRIDNKILVKLPDNIIENLFAIFNQIYAVSLFSDSWAEFLIFFIPKGNTGKFRPISLAQSLLKLLKRLIHNRLIWWLEHNHLLPDTQFGFRKNKSCTDNISILTANIYSSFANNSIVAALFLDVEDAFNGVDPAILAHKLRDLDLPENVCKFFYNLTSQRYIHFKINGETLGPYPSDKGLPQDCVSSPSLYNIGTKGVSNVLTNGCKDLSFADDVASTTSDDLNHCPQVLEKNLNKVSEFFNQLGLSISLHKTKLVVFTHKHIKLSEASIKFNGETIQASPEAKFLGITLDRKLGWNSHLNSLIKRCTMHINIISSLRSTWWGTHPESLLQLYKSLILGTIDYGLPCILPSNQKFFNKLGVIQRRVIRLALELQKSTPNKIVYAESHEHPIRIRQFKLASNYILKCFSITNHPELEHIASLESVCRVRNLQTLSRHPLASAYNSLSRYKPRIHSRPTPLCYFHSLDWQ